MVRKISLLIVVSLFVVSTTVKTQTVVINEFMADNSETIADPSGSYDDWIEIYNFGTEPVDIGGMYITDDFAEPMKYQIPQGNDSTVIQPQGFLLLWADEDLEQGVLHIDIKLSKSGEEIALYNPDGSTLADSVSFGQQQTDISYGRQPNGASTWVLFDDPTPGWSNGTTGIFNVTGDLFSINPNPAEQFTTISFPFDGEKTITICDLNGNQVYGQSVSQSVITVNCDSFTKGTFIVKVKDVDNRVQQMKLIVR